MNTHVNFEIAKLLKENGYNKRSEPSRYNNYGELTMLEGINAPTIAEVVMWLYEKHRIWVDVVTDRAVANFGYNITTRDNIHYTDVFYVGWSSPTAAYEAAIIYTLNNLI